MTPGTSLLIILILLLIGALPGWPYRSGWGYRPTDRPPRYCADHPVADGTDLGGEASDRAP